MASSDRCLGAEWSFSKSPRRGSRIGARVGAPGGGGVVGWNGVSWGAFAELRP